MTGRHAAPPDELFDQRERDSAGSHRADVEVPLGPDDTAPVKRGAAVKRAAAAKRPAARAKAAPVKKTPPSTTNPPSPTKKAGNP